MPARGNRRIASALLLAAILSVAALPCGLFDVGLQTGFDWVDQVTDAKRYEEEQEWLRAEREHLLHESETEMAGQRQQLSLTQTAVAAILTARAAPAAAQSYDDHTPVIMGVDFPAIISSNGAVVPGTIRFTDAGQDVNMVAIQTVQGTFASHTWDPGNSAVYDGPSGSIGFEAKCEVPESVRAVVTLQDATGHSSTQYVLAFRCE